MPQISTTVLLVPVSMEGPAWMELIHSAVSASQDLLETCAKLVSSMDSNLQSFSDPRLSNMHTEGAKIFLGNLRLAHTSSMIHT